MATKNTSLSPRCTLDTLARELGVSKTTVSLVLNGKGKIGADTRRRIERAVQNLNYQPRVVRRRSKPSPARRLGHVGIVCPIPPLDVGRNDTLSGWILSAQQEIRRLGGDVSLFVGSRRIQDDHLFEVFLRRGGMDGILLMGIGDEDGYMPVVQQSGLPAVVVNRRPVNEGFSYVAWDDIGAGQKMADHLTGLGHRRLAVVYNDAPGRLFHRHRCDGFVAALARGGAEPVLVCGSHDFSDQANQDLVRRLRDARATAIFATNDVRAVGLVNACEHLGISVPRRISIAGFDNTEQRSTGGLRPTSAGCVKQNISVEAVSLMSQLLDPDRKVRFLARVLDVDVVVHDTTGPVGVERSESDATLKRRRAASIPFTVS